MQTWQVHCGDALTVLKTLPAQSVNCVVTSPPYFGLRDYQTGTWEGGSEDCSHQKDRAVGVASSTLEGGKSTTNHQREASYRDVCGLCGARRVDRQVGLEDSPQAYVSSLVAVFAECRRVLVDDGTMWINLGDSYGSGELGRHDAVAGREYGKRPLDGQVRQQAKIKTGVKQKDLIGIPWSVAFALRNDGWYLRSEIIWHKKSCMPESVKDRPTKAHEQVFLLTKQPRYFYDADAIRETAVPQKRTGISGYKCPRDYDPSYVQGGARSSQKSTLNGPSGDTRNARSVWHEDQLDDGQMLIAEDMERFPQFETYDGEGQKDYEANGVQNPSAVKARIVHKSKMLSQDRQFAQRRMYENRDAKRAAGAPINHEFGCGANARSVWSLGPEPATDIEHFAVMPKTLARRCILAGCPFGGTVLDPFAGSGTTGIVALEEGRNFIGVELNPKYHAMARKRLGNTAPLLAQEISA